MADRVVFLRPDAERIARVVRRVEGMREGSPLTFGPVLESSQRKVFRVCTFNGAWATGTPKTVTFKYQASTPNTVSALNLFFPITENAVAADCAVAKEGTAWYLIDVPFQTTTITFASDTRTGFFAVGTTPFLAILESKEVDIPIFGDPVPVLKDVSVSASLNAECGIDLEVSKDYQDVDPILDFETAIVAISIGQKLAITSAATAVFSIQTATAAVLTFKVT
jgi:hypothetical protein